MTATGPDGVVHTLNAGNPNRTRCGIDATGWSRHVTDAQLAGLVLFCGSCGDR